MKSLKDINVKKILISFFWISLGIASLVLLISAMHKKDKDVCKGYEIEIVGINNNFFVGKTEILDILEKVAGRGIKGKSLSSLNLLEMENQIKKDVWISKATLYFDKNDILMIKVEEKNPVARVFSTEGTSFYIDHALNILPLSKKHAARLPVFTNFPSALKVLSKADSSLLNNIKTMSLFIQTDPFLMAMIDQVNISASNKFELIPKLGDQIILFGDASDADKKFDKLKLFYKNVISVKGWRKYSKINLQFDNQIVASILGVEEQIADSLKTMKMIKEFADYSEKMASDTSSIMQIDNEKNTVNESMILNSISRDDEPEETNALPNENSATKTNLVVPSTPIIKNKNTGSNNLEKSNAKPVVKSVVKPASKPAVKKVEKIEGGYKPKTMPKQTNKPEIKKINTNNKPKVKKLNTTTNNDY